MKSIQLIRVSLLLLAASLLSVNVEAQETSLCCQWVHPVFKKTTCAQVPNPTTCSKNHNGTTHRGYYCSIYTAKCMKEAGPPGPQGDIAAPDSTASKVRPPAPVNKPSATDARPAILRSGGKVQILEVVGEVEVSPGGDDSQAYVLKAGDSPLMMSDRIVTAMDSRVRLRFPNGETVWVKELTDMKVVSFKDPGNLVHTRLWLRGGEVAATVNKGSERPADFAVKTPTATAGVRGTQFSVRHVAQPDPLTVIRVTSGTVEIVPDNGQLPTVSARAGAEVRVSSDRITGTGPYTQTTRPRQEKW